MDTKVVKKSDPGAMHWLTKRAFVGGEIACGTAAQWRAMRDFTEVVDSVTCEVCVDMLLADGYTVRGEKKPPAQEWTEREPGCDG